jgi:hypothetical protein
VANFGKPKVCKVGEHFDIALNLPENVSKRSVDRFLFKNGVPGARSRRNKLKVVRGHLWDVDPKVAYHEPFKWVDEKGKFRGKFVKKIHYSNCSCCGSWTEIVPVGTW